MQRYIDYSNTNSNLNPDPNLNILTLILTLTVDGSTPLHRRTVEPLFMQRNSLQSNMFPEYSQIVAASLVNVIVY